MRATERYVSFYDLVIKARAQHAPTPTISQLITLWKTYGVEKGYFHKQDKGTLRYRIGHMADDEIRKAAILLIRRADQHAPNATFSKLDTGKLRVAEKLEDEGGDIAAHLIILTMSHKPNTYFCFIETAAGLSHRNVQRLLNDLIRQACKNQGKASNGSQEPIIFGYQDPSGANGKEKSFQPNIELRGYVADTFVQDLDEGTLRKIELVKSKARTPIGGDEYLVESEAKLVIEPKKGMPGQGKFDRIMSAVSNRKNDYDTARINFKDQDEKAHTVDVRLDDGSAEQQLYDKSARIREISPPLDQSSESIHKQFSARMINLMVQERDATSCQTSSINSDVA